MAGRAKHAVNERTSLQRSSFYAKKLATSLKLQITVTTTMKKTSGGFSDLKNFFEAGMVIDQNLKKGDVVEYAETGVVVGYITEINTRIAYLSGGDWRVAMVSELKKHRLKESEL
jgi:UDP-N-acetyl-D-mannosaminuronate dehydrogenase